MKPETLRNVFNLMMQKVKTHPRVDVMLTSGLIYSGTAALSAVPSSNLFAIKLINDDKPVMWIDPDHIAVMAERGALTGKEE